MRYDSFHLWGSINSLNLEIWMNTWCVPIGDLLWSESRGNCSVDKLIPPVTCVVLEWYWNSGMCFSTSWSLSFFWNLLICSGCTVLIQHSGFEFKRISSTEIWLIDCVFTWFLSGLLVMVSISAALKGKFCGFNCGLWMRAKGNGWRWNLSGGVLLWFLSNFKPFQIWIDGGIESGSIFGLFHFWSCEKVGRWRNIGILWGGFTCRSSYIFKGLKTAYRLCIGVWKGRRGEDVVVFCIKLVKLEELIGWEFWAWVSEMQCSIQRISNTSSLHLLQYRVLQECVWKMSFLDKFGATSACKTIFCCSLHSSEVVFRGNKFLGSNFRFFLFLFNFQLRTRKTKKLSHLKFCDAP